MDVTKQSFFEGIKYAKAGHLLNEIGAAIGDYAESFGYGVVEELCGHGIGSNLHEDQEIPNFRQKRRGIKLVPGMTLAVEPMINMGSADIFQDEEDGWTVYTEDGLPSAQWEIQVLVTEEGTEVISW